MTIGAKIKEIRTSRGLTQKKLAEKSGLAEITIRQYENEKREPKIDALIKIASALNVTVISFLDGAIKSEDEEKIMAKQLAFEAGLNKRIASALDSGEIDILYLYRKLNSKGKKEAGKRMVELTLIPDYRKDTE